MDNGFCNIYRIEITDLNSNTKVFDELSRCLLLSCMIDEDPTIFRMSKCDSIDRALCYKAAYDAISDAMDKYPDMESLFHAFDGFPESSNLRVEFE